MCYLFICFIEIFFFSFDISFVWRLFLSVALLFFHFTILPCHATIVLSFTFFQKFFFLERMLFSNNKGNIYDVVQSILFS